MKIEIETHNPDWKKQFEQIRCELLTIIGFLNPRIEHIGSTAVTGLAAKPIIDVLVGLEKHDLLDQTIEPLLDRNYVYYPIFNETMPYRRFFIKHKSELTRLNTIQHEKDIPRTTSEHKLRLAHIHIVEYMSPHWKRHTAFRDYLREHLFVRQEYQNLKKNLSIKEWIDGNDYNKAKDSFIKAQEIKALAWSEKIKTTNQ